MMGGNGNTLEDPAFWKINAPPAHMGRFYQSAWTLLAKVLIKPDAELIKKIGEDIGDPAISRGMRPPSASGLRIVVATPVMGPEVSMLYCASLFRMGVAVRDADFSLLIEYERDGKRDVGRVHMGHVIESNWTYARDLVRSRSRAVRRFLATDGTHMLFLDADISFKIEAIAGLVSAKADFVACPYPRKEINWPRARLAATQGKDPEAHASSYAYRLEKRAYEKGSPYVPVEAIGLGCALISRRCLETMTEAYRRELQFHDDGDGDLPTVALFQLMMPDVSDTQQITDEISNALAGVPIPKRMLYGEDYSFCERWRKLGGKIQMYTGPGAPVDHVGANIYRGFREGMIGTDAPAKSVDQ